MQNFDLDSSDGEVKEKVVSDIPPMQPEILFELSLGKRYEIVLVIQQTYFVTLCVQGNWSEVRLLSTTTAQLIMTFSSKGPGTYPYMAPEMFKKGRRGCAVDVYSLGCLYLEVFSRCRVWPGLDSTEIMISCMP